MANSCRRRQLWGNPSHMISIAKGLRAKYAEDKLHILIVKSNSGNFTYDGIETGGERVCVEIEEQLAAREEKGGKFAKLSIVGYSLGGLVARYAIGLLYANGVLDKLECMVRRPPLCVSRGGSRRARPGTKR